MITKTTFAIALVTTFLVAYCIITSIDHLRDVGIGMFILSPFLIVWMVYVVLKYGNYKGRELAPDEEYGYEDVNKRKP